MDEHQFATNFDVHRGYRVLTRSQVSSVSDGSNSESRASQAVEVGPERVLLIAPEEELEEEPGERWAGQKSLCASCRMLVWVKLVNQDDKLA